MRVLDWRPGGEKLLTSLWPASAPTAGAEIAALGRIWNRAHDAVVRARLLSRGPLAGAPPVVSVGNLALGGTGKTPVVIALAKGLADLGFTGSVLTRGYGSALPGPLAVAPDAAGAGDEARLLADELAGTGWPVVQSRNRRRGLRHLIACGAGEVVLLEDGHQTRGIERCLDVLILDHWREEISAAGSLVVPCTGPAFPFGPWRESATGARRAAIWLLETEAEAPARGMWGQQVTTFTRRMVRRPGNAAAAEAGPPRAAGLVAGIARPQKFEQGVAEHLDGPARLAVRLADHQPYCADLAGRLSAELAAAGCDALVTTAKDWIKLGVHWPPTVPAHIMDLQIRWGHGEALPALVGERLQSAR